MCYGFDGESALERTVENRGIDRRTVLRGMLGTAVAAGVSGSVLGGAAPAGAVADNQRGRRVPLDRISIQLWTLRDAFGWPDAPEAEQRARYEATLRRVADIGYPRVELALGYFGHTVAQLRRFYRSIGVRPTSSHDGLTDTADALRTKLENAAALDQQYIVVPYLEAPLSLTPAQRRAQWQQWAERMNVEAAAARRYGLRYGYHNHAHEFGDDLGGGLTPWDVLTTELDRRLVHFEMDIYWIATGLMWSGQAREATVETEIIDRIRSIPQRVRQYHVKDRDPGQPAHRTDGPQVFADPGTGMIDFGRIFDASAAEEYIVENDSPDVTPLQTAEVGYRYLSTLVFPDEVRGRSAGNHGKGRGRGAA
jgi:sugar phosphate isomerase/epimerase